MQYLHLLNLQSLFEFSISCVQDYDCAMKNSKWPTFRCLTRMLLLFKYSRSVLVFLRLLHYWFKKDLPVKELFLMNHVLFSEEIGEVALSVLAHSEQTD